MNKWQQRVFKFGHNDCNTLGFAENGCFIDKRLQRIWSQTHLIPGLPVANLLSPWTNNPHLIDPFRQMVPWKNGPQNFGPPRQMVPNQFGPHISGSPQTVPLDKLNILGTICPGDPNWLEIICTLGPNLWGPFFHGGWIGWDLFVQRDQSIGDQLWLTKCLGTICVWDQMCHRQ